MSFLRTLLGPGRHDKSDIQQVNRLRAEYSRLTDVELDSTARGATDLLPMIAATAVIASRVLGQDMFDVQLRGVLALTRGSIAEMQTGEGKTLTAVPAVAWYARQGPGVHVMTVNDYLARRDAQWMGPIYRRLGLSVGYIQQGMTAAQRRAAYACDITYATSNEIGFDFLRDRLALDTDQLVHRPFESAVVDEADSILIDEARIPLVIAGGSRDESTIAVAAGQVVRHFQPHVDYTVDAGARNVALTDRGIRSVESWLGCGNLYDERNLRLYTAIQDALHAQALLRRDVDYVVKNGSIELVDEFKGRIAPDRRWPAGLHTAVEIKEGVAAKRQGHILGSITLHYLVQMYPRVCGMTGTASTQAIEFDRVYGLRVEVIPPNRPVIRVDHPDALFQTKAEKERTVVEEIRRAHDRGQPVLVGTGSVADSERLSSMLPDIPHHVLNARNDEAEAAIIAQAGERGAVTISTNMAGRGTDIRLGDGVTDLGGLYVIGANKHESRRIDNQLRGRAGRQGDPGCSRFFVSMEDDLLLKYGDINPRVGTDPENVQRLVEGQHLDTRLFLQRYEIPVEGERNRIHAQRQDILQGRIPFDSEIARVAALRAIDDAWADALARIAEFREGVQWISWGGRNPHFEYLKQVDEWLRELEETLPAEIERRVQQAEAGVGPDPRERGAVWTYLTTDQPFGSWTERVLRGFIRRMKGEQPSV